MADKKWIKLNKKEYDSWTEFKSVKRPKRKKNDK